MVPSPPTSSISNLDLVLNSIMVANNAKPVGIVFFKYELVITRTWTVTDEDEQDEQEDEDEWETGDEQEDSNKQDAGDNQEDTDDENKNEDEVTPHCESFIFPSVTLCVLNTNLLKTGTPQEVLGDKEQQHPTSVPIAQHQSEFSLVCSFVISFLQVLRPSEIDVPLILSQLTHLPTL